MAASAFAVESANVVGYQESSSVAGFNWVAPNFTTVGETTACFGDISIAGDDVVEYGDNIQIVDADGNCDALYYWTGADGWFDMDGSGEYMNDEAIVRGKSVIVYTDVAGATIRVKGEVITNSVVFAEGSVAGFNWVGNPFPVDITYANISIAGDDVVEYGDNIQNVDADGNCDALYYWTGVDGWFDMDGSGEYMNDVIIPAGKGFIVYTDVAGATITIKGPQLSL